MADYITGSEFEVFFDKQKVNFSKVANIISRIEYETYAEGGVNDRVLVFKKPRQEPDTVIFEKGQSAGASKEFFSSIKEGAVIKNVMIYVKHNGENVRALSFEEGIVVSKELSVIDALSKEVLIEKMKVAHSGLKEVQVK